LLLGAAYGVVARQPILALGLTAAGLPSGIVALMESSLPGSDAVSPRAACVWVPVMYGRVPSGAGGGGRGAPQLRHI